MSRFKELVSTRVLPNVTEHLGELAEFKPCKGDGFSVQVVFDNAFVRVDPDSETDVSSRQPRLLVRLDDFPNKIEENDRFILTQNSVSTEYKVWTVEEDGQGGAEVYLHRVRREL